MFLQSDFVYVVVMKICDFKICFKCVWDICKVKCVCDNFVLQKFEDGLYDFNVGLVDGGYGGCGNIQFVVCQQVLILYVMVEYKDDEGVKIKEKKVFIFEMIFNIFCCMLEDEMVDIGFNIF